MNNGITFTNKNGRITTPPLREINKNCEEVALTDPGNTQKVASVLLKMSLHYYQSVRTQAQQSFQAALAAAAVGTVFFIAAAGFVMNGTSDRATVSLIAGTLIQVISGINFYLYGKAGRQFSLFHVCLERMNRFLIANSICANLDRGDMRDEMRADLVRIVAEASMLTVDGAPEPRQERMDGATAGRTMATEAASK